MEQAVELFGEDDEHQRSYALNLIGMATVHLLQREPEQSTVLAGQALKIAKKVRSERVNTRLRKTVDTAATGLRRCRRGRPAHRPARRPAAGVRRSGLTRHHRPRPRHASVQPDSAPPCQVIRRGAVAGSRRTALRSTPRRFNRTVCGVGRMVGSAPDPPPGIHSDVTRTDLFVTLAKHRAASAGNGAAPISWRTAVSGHDPPDTP